MQELIEKIARVEGEVARVNAAIELWKANSGTIVVEKLVEVVKEVPVEVIKEVEKVVAPDTSALESKLDDLTGKLGGAADAIGALTSVAPVVEKAADVVGDAVVEANEAPVATPATDAFVATEPAVTEEPAAVIAEEAVAAAAVEEVKVPE